MIEFPVLSIKNIVKREFSRWTNLELLFSIFAVSLVLISSFYKHDSTFAMISATCGIIYTILAGKGKVSCYFFGIIGTLCCAYISYDITLYGNCILHFMYYFPMEVIGFFTWRKHLDKTTNEIIKERLSDKELVTMSFIVAISTIVAYIVFSHIGDKSPFVDASITTLSVAGMFLTVRRSIEQWIVWTIVNFLSIIMWFGAYEDGEKIFSIFIVRIIYFILGIYFFIKWKKSRV